MSSWIGLNFQDSRRLGIGELNFLHDHIIIVITRVIVLISLLVFLLRGRGFYYKFFSEGTTIETIWSILPALLLVILLFPSIKILYLVEDVKNPSLTFKVVAHQWYWRYAVPLLKNLRVHIKEKNSNFFEFDSNLETREEQLRLLSCSNDFFIPTSITSRLMITSTDVIHSFSLPAIGLKVDAVPGRINQLFCTPSRMGVFFGQCSEICGSNHSFMPICVKFCPNSYFEKIRKFYLIERVRG